MDQEPAASIVSGIGNRAELVEIRADAFAVAFLMPEKGIKRIVQTLGGGRSVR
jgi:Zn-dependent peptidase ImmA (M78 family)